MTPSDDFAADETVLAALRAAGAPEAVITAAQVKPASEDDFEVWPENWPALGLFLDLATCWSWIPLGLAPPVRTGIPATELEAAMRINGVKRKAWRALARDIRLMEDAALNEFRDE